MELRIPIRRLIDDDISDPVYHDKAYMKVAIIGGDSEVWNDWCQRRQYCFLARQV